MLVLPDCMFFLIFSTKPNGIRYLNFSKRQVSEISADMGSCEMTVHLIFSNSKWFINYNKIYHGIYFPGTCQAYESWSDELDHVECIARDNGE